MSKRKYQYEKMTQEELAALEAAFPKAVRQVTVRRPNYNIIAQLLNCGLTPPGVRLIGGAAESTPIEQAIKSVADSDVLPGEKPTFVP